PLTLTTSDAKLQSLQASTGSGGRTRFTATLRVSEPLTVVATLRSGSPRRTIHLTRFGVRSVSVSWTLPVGARRSYHVVLMLRDSYGRTRRVGRSVTGG
ncbi:MAG: hypothetical protein M3018_11200, partial [Actinomycetota bacterium]|nr:hypothetical protein [Actinomycetota bacterium]